VTPDFAKASVLNFGVFELDLRNRELRRNGVLISIQPQPFNLLAMLAARPGRLITRDEVRQELWPGEQAGDFDSRLNFYVRKIREALDDDADRPRYLKTHRKLGYTFITPVVRTQASDRASDPAGSELPLGAGGRAERIVAVQELPPAGPVTVTRTPRSSLKFVVLLAACPSLLIVAWVFAPHLWGSAPLPRITATVQLTHDGLPKSGWIRSGGGGVYFSEERDYRRAIARVPETGGDTTALPLPASFAHPSVADVSPDGSELLLLDQARDYDDVPLWIVPSSGGQPARLGNIVAHAASWRPDGTAIVYAAGRDLWSVKPDGSGMRRLASLPGPVIEAYWSPDGKLLSLSVLDPAAESFSIWQIAANGPSPRQVLPSYRDGNEVPLGWFDGGSYFALARYGRGAEIHLFPEKPALRGAVPTPVTLDTNLPGFTDGTAFSKDGTRLFAMTPVQTSGELVRYDSSRHRFEDYLPGCSFLDLTFSRDAKRMAYISLPDGVLWSARADGTDPHQLTFAPLRVELPAWSPDGKQIAFMARTPGKPWKVQLIAADGGKLEPLLPGNEDHSQGAPTWTPDGGSIVFGDVDCIPPAVCAIHEVDLRSRTLTTLPGSQGLRTARVSPDGRYVAALGQGHQGVFLFDFKTTKWTRLLAASISGDDLAWSKDGKYIYGFDEESSDPAVFRLRILDHRLEHIVPLAGLAPLHSPWVGLDSQDDPLLFHTRAAEEIFAVNWSAR
jgi:Tol biopolymer transport system component/DNA-binding winged helix-turn-helix (wHTH) protein